MSQSNNKYMTLTNRLLQSHVGVFMPFPWTAVELAVDFALAFLFLQWVISFDDAQDRIDASERGQGEGEDVQVRHVRELPHLAGDGRELQQEHPLVVLEDFMF